MQVAKILLLNGVRIPWLFRELGILAENLIYEKGIGLKIESWRLPKVKFIRKMRNPNKQEVEALYEAANLSIDQEKEVTETELEDFIEKYLKHLQTKQ